MKNKLALDGRYYNVFEKDNSLRAKIVESEKEGLYIIRLSLSKRDSLVCPLCTDGKKCLKNSEALSVLYNSESNLQLRNPDLDYNYFNLSAKVCSKTKKMYLINGSIQERITSAIIFLYQAVPCAIISCIITPVHPSKSFPSVFLPVWIFLVS